MIRLPTTVVVLFGALALGGGVASAGPIEDARAAIAADPGAPAGYEALAREQLRAGDPDGAIETYRALIAAAPGYTKGRYRLAFALRKADRLAEAAEAYVAYIALEPGDPDGVFGLARTREKLGDRAAARAAYARYVEIETRPSEAKWVAEARERIAAIDAEAAPVAAAPVAAPSAAPAAPPASPAEPAEAAAVPSTAAPPTAVPSTAAPPAEGLLADSPLSRATPAADPDAAFAAGRYPEAAAGYRARIAAMAAGAAGADLHYRAAVAAALAGDPVVAAEHAAAAARLAPGSAPAGDLARATRAEIDRIRAESSPAVAEVERALRDGRLRTASRLAGEALAAGPDPASASRLHWARGRALAGLGRLDEAFDALKRAAERHPANPALWAELGRVADRRGDPAAARAFSAIAAAVAPDGHPLRARSGPTEEP